MLVERYRTGAPTSWVYRGPIIRSAPFSIGDERGPTKPKKPFVCDSWSVQVRDAPPTSPVPAELQSAIDEMKHAFGYDRYAPWDAIVIQPRGPGEQQGILPMDPNSIPYTYSLSYQQAEATGSGNLALYGFQFTVKMPASFYGKDGIESHIKTDVTIREGQKLVLGKIRLLPPENADLFLVLTSKVH
jgi:hypothetical protein